MVDVAIGSLQGVLGHGLGLGLQSIFWCCCHHCLHFGSFSGLFPCLTLCHSLGQVDGKSLFGSTGQGNELIWVVVGCIQVA